MSHIFVTQSWVDESFRRYTEKVMESRIQLAEQLQHQGGECPLCHREFDRIKVDNAYGNFEYFIPACYCYKTCDRIPRWWYETNSRGDEVFVRGFRPGCGRIMIAERLMNVKHCTDCEPEGPQPEPVFTKQPISRKKFEKARQKVIGQNDE